MSEAQSKYGGARVHFPPPLVFLALVSAGVVNADLILTHLLQRSPK
jgi:hypothetical protein